MDARGSGGLRGGNDGRQHQRRAERETAFEHANRIWRKETHMNVGVIFSFSLFVAPAAHCAEGEVSSVFVASLC